MISGFRASNFRCFKELELKDCGRVNIVVGKNASGKTALLEAIRLSVGGTPQVALSLNQQRAAVYYGGVPTKELFEGLWNSLFYKFDTTGAISMECVNSNGRTASLRMFFDREKSVTLPLQPQITPSPLTTIVPLSFERSDFSGVKTTLNASVQAQGGLNLDQGPELGLATEFFASTWASNPQQNANWFSQLSLENREREVIEAIRTEFDPLINDLQVLSVGSPGVFASVYASVPFLETKIPLTLVSAGINKFFTLLSIILYRRGGVVLVDEIENGLYFERLKALWTTILRLAKQNDTQIFASTHSLECLRAIPIKGNEEDFRLLHVGRVNGSSAIETIEGQFFEAALEQTVELR